MCTLIHAAFGQHAKIAPSTTNLEHVQNARDHAPVIDAWLARFAMR